MASDESETCAVCLDATELVVMPCCGRAGTTNFCQRCIETICEMADGGYGSCPKCRKTIAVHGGAVVVAEARGQCRIGICGAIGIGVSIGISIGGAIGIGVSIGISNVQPGQQGHH
jgi:hypothetical protein